MKSTFRFVYYFCEGEAPESRQILANNITNAKLEWEESKNDFVLLAIFKGDREIWRSEVETGFLLDLI